MRGLRVTLLKFLLCVCLVFVAVGCDSEKDNNNGTTNGGTGGDGGSGGGTVGSRIEDSEFVKSGGVIISNDGKIDNATSTFDMGSRSYRLYNSESLDEPLVITNNSSESIWVEINKFSLKKEESWMLRCDDSDCGYSPQPGRHIQINPNSTAEFKVRYTIGFNDNMFTAGKKTGYLSIQNDILGKEIARLNIKLELIAMPPLAFEIDNTSIDFGTIKVNEKITKVFTISNTSDSDFYLNLYSDRDISSFPGVNIPSYLPGGLIYRNDTSNPIDRSLKAFFMLRYYGEIGTTMTFDEINDLDKKLDFKIVPNEKHSVTVEFYPSATGTYNGSINIYKEVTTDSYDPDPNKTFIVEKTVTFTGKAEL